MLPPLLRLTMGWGCCLPLLLATAEAVVWARQPLLMLQASQQALSCHAAHSLAWLMVWWPRLVGVPRLCLLLLLPVILPPCHWWHV